MKALYRKYRPTKLSEVIGEPQVTSSLAKSLKTAKISHAYLFTGPRGCGKTSVARIFAHEVNDFKYELEDSYPDIIEIDAASNTGVDNIRELREHVAIAPSKGKYKVYIIDEVHMLSKSAFNALLKTIEEPPSHVIFIMATTDAYKVPDTIVSRSQVYTFHLADPKTMKDHLKSIADKEKIDIASDALDIIVSRGGGSFRDTISLLDQVTNLSSDKITAQTIISALGLPENQQLENLFNAYESGNLAEISDRLKALLSSGVKPEIIAQEIISQIIAAPKATLLPLLKSLPEVQAPFAEAKLLLAFTENLASLPPQITTTATPAPTAAKPKTTPEASIPETTPPEKPSSNTFNWDEYLTTMKSANQAIFNTLAKSAHRLSGRTIEVIPKKPFYKNILQSQANMEVLKKYLPEGYSLKILDADQSIGQASPTKDSTLSQISDIMGSDIQEVKINDGDPF